MTGEILTPFVRPERLFSDLDGRDLTASGCRWRIEVYGVCDQGDQRWIQLGVRGVRGTSTASVRRHMLTLILRRGEGARQAMPVLATWLANPDQIGVVRSVA